MDGRVFSFDLEGRLWTAMKDGISYRRGLNGKVIAKWPDSKNRRLRRWITHKENLELIQTSHDLVRGLEKAIRQDELQFDGPISPNDKRTIQRISSRGLEFYQQDIRRFYRVYLPVGILPPDQYMAVVVQATEGCSFNGCSFCDFYKDRRFRIKSADELRSHARSIKEYLGQGLSLRRTIFLGDANSLVIPTKQLFKHFEVINAEFQVEEMGGIYAFMDGFDKKTKTHQDFVRLNQLGLKRVYIGLESGSQKLLRFLGKPISPKAVIDTVNLIKGAEIAVGIIVLLGAGGKTFERDHINETIATLNSMNLDLNDIVYFSELVENEGLAYTTRAFETHLHALSTSEVIQQEYMITDGLIFSEAGGTPHISRYDIREFVY